MTTLGTPERPLRVAIIGSGPSGFYAAEALLNSSQSVQVDMLERLPVPYGLVRSGVAPDHQKIKSVTRIYEKIAKNPSFNYLGNVEVGKDISVNELKNHYDALLFACGAASDNRLGITGEDLAGSHTATEFVAWYNGHPDYRERQFDLSQKVAVIIGQGNVAVDVCRVLAKTVDELKVSDIAQHALDALAQSQITDIYMVGRRGPAQAAFTPQEMKELGELAETDLIIHPDELELNPASAAELEMADKSANRKNYELMKTFSQRPTGSKPRRLHIVFFRGPSELKGQSAIESVVLEKNQLSGEAGQQKARGSGEFETLPCGLFFRSVGYRGLPMVGVPFDERKGVFPNEKGRITGAEGLYVTGWIKRGPSGVIGTNKPDSVETVAQLLADLPQLAPCAQPDSAALQALLQERQVRVVSFDDWQKIDAAEVANGQKVGKPREKFTTVTEMMAVLN